MLTLLMIQLQSFSRLAIVFFTAPLGIVGASIALNLANQPFGFVALLGLIALAGMDMRNTVILVDQIETDVRERGLTRREAIVVATVRRARPVVLTALAAILAMIPLSRERVLGADGDHHHGRPFVATFLTLFPAGALRAVVPQVARASARARQRRASRRIPISRRPRRRNDAATTEARMFLDWTLASLHHLAVFTLAAILAFELALTAGAIDRRQFSASRGSTPGTARWPRWRSPAGIARVFLGAKGPEYYAANGLFWTKMALFAAIAALSVLPTLRYIVWRRASRADEAYPAGCGRGARREARAVERSRAVRRHPALRRGDRRAATGCERAQSALFNSFSLPNTESTSIFSSTSLALGVGAPNTSAWRRRRGTRGGDLGGDQRLAAVLLDLRAILGGAVDLEIEIDLRAEAERHRVHRLQIGGVPVAALADRFQRVLGRADEAHDLRVLQLGMVAQQPEDRVRPVLAARKRRIARAARLLELGHAHLRGAPDAGGAPGRLRPRRFPRGSTGRSKSGRSP